MPGLPFRRWPIIGRDRPTRWIIGPSLESITIRGTAERQPALLQADRAPALFQLSPPDQAGLIAVRQADGAAVGYLDEPGSPVARHYARTLRSAARRGQEVWVHGQVRREGLELVVVLRCPSGRL